MGQGRKDRQANGVGTKPLETLETGFTTSLGLWGCLDFSSSFLPDTVSVSGHSMKTAMPTPCYRLP